MAKPVEEMSSFARFAAPRDLVFFDGACALCHRAVCFLARRDSGGTRFRFAPLGGPTFLHAIPTGRRAALPDSIAVLTAEGKLLTRSDAVILALRRLGGVWGAAATVFAAIPRRLRDASYDMVARKRFSIFGRAQASCPVTPPELRQRFEP